jgi:3-oxoacyl-[acyl-carrier-protein] synthase-3
LALEVRCHPEHAADMVAVSPDGRKYWEPGTSPITLGFSEQRVVSIMHRGNQLVPEVARRVCAAAHVERIDLLVTNQPNTVFLRNWREALELPPERHHDTYDRYGNLFGAGIPINLDDAITNGSLARGGDVVLAGFSHAGDYSAAAVLRFAPIA